LNVIGPTTRSASLALDAWHLVEQREQLGNIMTIGPGQGGRQRDAIGICQQMVLASQFAPIRGIWASFLASARSAHRGAVHEGTIPIDLVGCLEFREQCFENLLPNSRLLPSPKVAEASVSGGKIAGSGQGTPGYAGMQNEEDAVENPPGLRRFSSSELHMAVPLRLWQPRFQAFPQMIRQH
jgi:hypothetical protein